MRANEPTMKAAMKNPHRGFTLIELMVVVAIIGVLAAIAYPSYLQQTKKSRRADAKAALLDLATKEERYMSVNNKYTATLTDLGYVSGNVQSGSSVYYVLSITGNTALTTFSATATAQGNQATDKCGNYRLDYQGVQNVSGTETVANCW